MPQFGPFEDFGFCAVADPLTQNPAGPKTRVRRQHTQRKGSRRSMAWPSLPGGFFRWRNLRRLNFKSMPRLPGSARHCLKVERRFKFRRMLRARRCARIRTHKRSDVGNTLDRRVLGLCEHAVFSIRVTYHETSELSNFRMLFCSRVSLGRTWGFVVMWGRR